MAEVVRKDDRWHAEEPSAARSARLTAFLAEQLGEELAGRTPDALAFPAPKGGYLRNLTFRRGWFDRAATEVAPVSLRTS